jgi:hypothetical protein
MSLEFSFLPRLFHADGLALGISGISTNTQYRDELPLPKNFEAVTMKASDYAMLEKRGIKVPKP